MSKAKKITLLLIFVTILAFGGLAVAQDQAPPAPGGPPPVDYDTGYRGPDGDIDQGAPPQNQGHGRGYGRGRYDDGPGYGGGYGRGRYDDGPGYGDDDYGPGYGGRRRGHQWRWRGGPELTQEQRTALEKLHSDHWAKVEPLLDQLRDNQLLYRALKNNPNAPVEEIKKAISELSRLRKELRTEASAFGQSLKDQGFSGFVPGDPGWGGHGGGGHRGGFGGCPIGGWGDGPDGDWDDDDDYGRRGHRGNRHRR